MRNLVFPEHNNEQINSAYHGAPPLTPKIAPWMKRLIQNKVLLDNLLRDETNPVNLFNLSEFKSNISAFKAIFESSSIQYKLYFARKANKLPCFVSAAKEMNIGVDVASLAELNETLSLGISPEKIVITGTGKSSKLIDQGIIAGCTLILDSFDDLALVSERSKTLNIPATTGLRFSGFPGLKGSKRSRFGFNLKDLPQIVKEVKRNEKQLQTISTLHAHIDKYEVDDRVRACEALLFISDILKNEGHPITTIDLGGGIPISYIDSEAEWSNFNRTFEDCFQKKVNSITYTGDFLASSFSQDTEYQLNIYPAYGTITREKFIERIMNSRSHSGKALKNELLERNLKIAFEPGRSLLDNCGATIAAVAFNKKDSDHNRIIGLHMNSTQLSPFRAELPIDPVLLSSRQERSEPCEGFIVGNMCSESDIIYKRCITFPFEPSRNDIFFFPNTAGYFIHHKEVGTHGLPLAKNIILHPEHLLPLYIYE